MKTLLFILFFPITVPVWLLYKLIPLLFNWLVDTFIPFLQYDVFPAIKRYIQQHSAEMEKNAEKLKQEREEEKNNIIESNLNTHIEGLEGKTEDISCEVSVSVNSSFDDIIGHGPPFTAEEYKKLRKTETEQQCQTLKECYNANDFESHWYCARIYSFWGAKYRLLSIYHYEKCFELNENTVFFNSVNASLGSLYEQCHDFEKAISIYKKSIELQPHLPAGYVEVASCLRKQNKLNEAIAFLEKAKSSKFYTSPAPYSCFDTCIDSKLEDLYKKRERGYSFKPKKESFEYYDYSMTIDEICNSYMQNWI